MAFAGLFFWGWVPQVWPLGGSGHELPSPVCQPGGLRHGRRGLVAGLRVGLACGVLLLPGFWGQQLQPPGSWAPNLHMQLRLLIISYIFGSFSRVFGNLKLSSEILGTVKTRVQAALVYKAHPQLSSMISGKKITPKST